MMRIDVFDTHGFEREYFIGENERFGYDLQFHEFKLTEQTARIVEGSQAVCAFVNDDLGEATLAALHRAGIQLIALRSAGFNHVDLVAAEALGLKVVRVPEYSPHAVAEYTVALMLSLNRNVHRAHSRVRDGNFSLEGLVGFDLHGKTVGIVGTGKIGGTVAKIMTGFGCRVLAYDLHVDPSLVSLGVWYENLERLFKECDILSLHVPLTPETRHLIDAVALSRMKSGVMLINTGRGALIHTRALIAALKSGKVGYAGLDVYEEEEKVFFRDLSDQIIQDDDLARLLTFPNVLVTSHQAFLTREALMKIAETTLQNVRDFEEGRPLVNEVRAEAVIRAA